MSLVASEAWETVSSQHYVGQMSRSSYLPCPTPDRLDDRCRMPRSRECLRSLQGIQLRDWRTMPRDLDALLPAGPRRQELSSPVCFLSSSCGIFVHSLDIVVLAGVGRMLEPTAPPRRRGDEVASWRRRQPISRRSSAFADTLDTQQCSLDQRKACGLINC